MNPRIELYDAAKSVAPEVIFLLRVGNFVFAYSADADELSTIFDIPLSHDEHGNRAIAIPSDLLSECMTELRSDGRRFIVAAYSDENLELQKKLLMAAIDARTPFKFRR